jgi:hypothetical protein
LYSKSTSIHTVNQWKESQRNSSVPKDKIYQCSRQRLQKYECVIAMYSVITCYFSVCSEDSEHTANHYTSQWDSIALSRGIVLKRQFELRHKVDFYLKNLIPLSLYFEDDAQICLLAYLADIFSKVNDLFKSSKWWK